MKKLFKQLAGSRPTSKMDVYLAAGAAVMAAIHFFDVKRQYNEQQNAIENEENRS